MTKLAASSLPVNIKDSQVAWRRYRPPCHPAKHRQAFSPMRVILSSNVCKSTHRSMGPIGTIPVVSFHLRRQFLYQIDSSIRGLFYRMGAIAPKYRPKCAARLRISFRSTEMRRRHPCGCDRRAPRVDSRPRVASAVAVHDGRRWFRKFGIATDGRRGVFQAGHLGLDILLLVDRPHSKHSVCCDSNNRVPTRIG